VKQGVGCILKSTRVDPGFELQQNRAIGFPIAETFK
jgi:hypothetical protein